MLIQEIYDVLKQERLCKSGYAFSRDYMRKGRSYYSVLKARDGKPSIEAWTMLNYALQVRAQMLASSENDMVQVAAQRLSALQQAVAANITEECAARNQ